MALVHSEGRTRAYGLGEGPGAYRVVQIGRLCGAGEAALAVYEHYEAGVLGWSAADVVFGYRLAAAGAGRYGNAGRPASGEEVVRFATLARLGATDLVLDPAVKGRVSAQLQQVPLKAALDVVAHLQGLEYQLELTYVLVVGTAECFRQGFARAYCVKLQYAKASEVANLLNDARKDKGTPAAAAAKNGKKEKTKNALPEAGETSANEPDVFSG